MVQRVPAVGSDVDVCPTVVVVVGGGNAHAVALSLHARAFRDVLKRTVVVLVIKAIPVLRIALFRHCPFRHGILEPRAISKVNIQAAVVVVVEERHAGAHSFEQVLPGCRGSLVSERDAGLPGNVGEGYGRRRLRRGSHAPGGACALVRAPRSSRGFLRHGHDCDQEQTQNRTRRDTDPPYPHGTYFWESVRIRVIRVYPCPHFSCGSGRRTMARHR